MKKLRSIPKKGQGGETSSFEGPSSEWEGLNPRAFESEAAAMEVNEQSAFQVNNQPIEPGSGRRGSSGFLKWIFFILLIGYGLFSYSQVPILTWIGSLLVVEHPVKRADLIVCTPGEPFAVGLMAADLYKKKMARNIFIPETPPPTALMLVNEKGGRFPTSGELLFSILKTLGVPASACILGKQSSETIQAEAEEVQRLVLDLGKSTVILVSAPWKSRRTWSIFDQVFEDDRVEIMMAPSTYTDFKPDNWWKTEKTLHETILEFQKLFGWKVTQIF